MRAAALVLMCAFSFPGAAQPETPIDVEDFAERLFQVQEEDINYEDLYESLLSSYTTPINLNKTTPEELGALYLLSPLQLNNLFTHIRDYGPLLSLYELQAIPGFTRETIRELLPFVTLIEKDDGRPLFQRIAKEENNYLLLRWRSELANPQGDNSTSKAGYLGNSHTYYSRFRISHPEDFSLGFTMEKDAGEPFSKVDSLAPYGFDFYSFHLLVHNKGLVKMLAIGDFQLQLGQGLVFGSGFGAGKGSETVTSVKRNSIGIRPYTSSLESGFFRGTGATFALGKTEATLFYSNLNQDARIRTDTTYSDFDEFTESIQSSGYHRTSSELAFKNQLREQSLGGALHYTFSNRFHLGTSMLYTGYSHAVQKKPNNYNQFEFNGEKNLVASLYGSYAWQNFIFFGEAARSLSGGLGMAGGWMTSLSSKIDMSIVFRKYDPDFHSFYSNSFSEGSRSINEQGVYWGLEIRPVRKVRCSLYYDRFSFPWLKYRVEAPSDGYEYMGRITYNPSRSMIMFIQFRQEKKEFTEPVNDNLNELVNALKRNYLFNLDFKLQKFLSFRSRVQASDYLLHGNLTMGITFIQDLNFEYGRFRLSTRMALFDTEDFNNRQYAHEKDVLYSFSIPAYSGQGIRNYLLLQVKATKKITLWARYARFEYQKEENQISELKLMSRIRF